MIQPQPQPRPVGLLMAALTLSLTSPALTAQPADLLPPGAAQEIFPLTTEHVHGSTLVELPGGDLLAAWFQGSGERWADDVRIMAARRTAGAGRWNEPFVLADTPEFPDINPVLFVDANLRLQLFWYTVIANQWETSLLKIRTADAEAQAAAPEWRWQEVLHVKPGGKTERGIQPDDPFVAAVERGLASYGAYLDESGALESPDRERMWERFVEETRHKAGGLDMVRSGRLRHENGTTTEAQLGYPYFRRMGWQTRNKPLELPSGRLVLPLYSDGFDFSLMALTDDGGRTWSFSEPLIGGANIQPALALGPDGSITAFMRDNGPPPHRLQVSRSFDAGRTWTPVRDTELPNPGSAADIVTLPNGNWVLVYNDTEEGRHSLAVAMSSDQGATWPWKRHLERDLRPSGATASHYPAVIAASDGTLHFTYSYHHNDRRGAPAKTIKHVRINEDWIREGDPP